MALLAHTVSHDPCSQMVIPLTCLVLELKNKQMPELLGFPAKMPAAEEILPSSTFQTSDGSLVAAKSHAEPELQGIQEYAISHRWND